jgi:diadenosine tetraphosphate (Ap4A) HIT family hydrolase
VTNDGCHVCALGASATDTQIVYRDDTWTAASPIAVPGWVMLFTDRHNEGVWELEPDEAEQFGRLTVLLTGALRQVCDADRVYVMYAGENALHFHAMLMARTADVPEEWRGARLLDRHSDLADPDRANSVLTALREKLAALSI